MTLFIKDNESYNSSVVDKISAFRVLQSLKLVFLQIVCHKHLILKLEQTKIIRSP